MEVIGSILKNLGFEQTTFFCQVGLFFLFHFSLNFLVYQPLMEMREKRDSKIARELAEAEAKTEEARKLKEDYEQKVRAARSEGQAGLAEVTEAAEAERKQRLEKAREEAQKIVAEARAEAESAREKAEKTVEDESEKVARAITKRMLRASLEPRDSEPLWAKIGGKS